ncbi:hypothetical protein ABPG74_005967 [Tetrahymena malaccensis]
MQIINSNRQQSFYDYDYNSKPLLNVLLNGVRYKYYELFYYQFIKRSLGSKKSFRLIDGWKGHRRQINQQVNMKDWEQLEDISNKINQKKIKNWIVFLKKLGMNIFSLLINYSFKVIHAVQIILLQRKISVATYLTYEMNISISLSLLVVILEIKSTLNYYKSKVIFTKILSQSIPKFKY